MRMSVFPLFAFVLLIGDTRGGVINLSVDLPKCGIRSFSRANRIYGGTEIYPGQYPWLALLRKYGHLQCGAFVIRRDVLVTAAHCFAPTDHPSQFTVTLGEHSRRHSEPGLSEQIIKVNKWEIHPNYTGQSERFLHDIALIWLDKPAHWVSTSVTPACLSDGVNEKKSLTAVGWGSTESHRYPDVAREIVVYKVNNSECGRMFKKHGYDFEPIEGQFCAGTRDGRDTCDGDSGGPLMYKTGDTRLSPFSVVGIVSTGLGCGKPDLPSIYTRISHYIPWIKQRLNSNSYS